MTRYFDSRTDGEFRRGTDRLLADIEALDSGGDPREGAWTDTLGMPVMLGGDGWPVAQSDCEL